MSFFKNRLWHFANNPNNGLNTEVDSLFKLC